MALELWKSDGTSDGTVMVKDINTTVVDGFPQGSNPSYLTNVGGTLYFRADNGANGAELWRSDGTSTGTYIVKDIRPGSSRSDPSRLTNVGGTLYFRANDGANGYELWRSDGTSTGTFMVKDIRPGLDGSNISYLMNVGGTLYFRANDGGHGYELWKSDGTSTGTVMVKDIRPGANSSEISTLTNVGGTLYFRANDGVSGYELWKSNGTSSGTELVKDIQPGTLGSSPYWLTNVAGWLYFTADDSTGGRELWRSDGTSEGTTLVFDLASGTVNSDPAQLTTVGHRLYFSAVTESIGRELFYTEVDNRPPIVVSGGPYTMTLGESLPFTGVDSSDPDGDQLDFWWEIIGKLGVSGVTPNTTWEELVQLWPTIQPGTYNVRLEVYDDHDGLTTVFTTLTIFNAPPTLSQLSVPAANEFQAVVLTGTVVDPSVFDRFTVTVDWGDGTAPQAFEVGVYSNPNAPRDFSVSHVYGDSSDQLPGGAYAISLTVTDSFGAASGPYTVAAVVNNLPPTANFTLLSSQPYTLKLLPVDPSPIDQGAPFTYIIDWGDGSPIETLTGPAGMVVSHPAGPLGSSTTIAMIAIDQDGGASPPLTRTIYAVREQIVNTIFTGSQQTATRSRAVGIDDNGTLAVVWADENFGAFVRRFDASGSALGAPITLPTGLNPKDFTIGMAPDGSYVLLVGIGGPPGQRACAAIQCFRPSRWRIIHCVRRHAILSDSSRCGRQQRWVCNRLDWSIASLPTIPGLRASL